MKSLLIISIFAFTFVYTIGATSISLKEIIEKRANAEKKCNASFPVSEDLRKKVFTATVKGEVIKMDDPSLWCNLNCYLQNVGFFDENSDIQAPKILKFALASNLRQFASYAHVFIAQLYDIIRSTRGIENKCIKAVITYKKFMDAIMVLGIAADFNEKTHLSEKLTKGEDLSSELENSINELFEYFDKELLKQIPK